MTRARLWACLTVVSVLAGAPVAAAQGTLIVAAASDLQPVLPEIVRRFERETGTRVTLSFGSSGTLFAQIRNGAPFDVFFSADADYPRRLLDARQADGSSLYHYATGRLVLWTRNDSGIQLARGLDVLTDPGIRRIAVANPEHAPYGRAAIAALERANVHDRVRPRLVFGENISQTAQLVESGNADVGILALSLAVGPTLSARGRHVEIPVTAHPPIDQAAVVVPASRNQEAARALLAYLKRSEIAELLRQSGFGPP